MSHTHECTKCKNKAWIQITPERGGSVIFKCGCGHPLKYIEPPVKVEKKRVLIDDLMDIVMLVLMIFPPLPFFIYMHGIPGVLLWILYAPFAFIWFLILRPERGEM